MIIDLTGNELVPHEGDRCVLKLLDTIDAEFEPIMLDIEPEPNANQLDCFIIIENKVRKFGGKRILGWQVWKTRFLIEAECHAVWEDAEGNLKDLTPKPDGITKILFIEDPRIEYKGRQINNIRLNITQNKLVDHFIETFNAKFRLQNKCERADHYDLSKLLTEFEIQEIQSVVMLQTGIAQILNSGGDEHSLCFCGKNKKYRNCHGADVLKKLKSLK